MLPVEDDEGNIFAGMIMIQDVTERTEHWRRLEWSDERLAQFAYAGSHDLQEPLRMVSSYLRLIEQRYTDELEESGRECIEFAVDGSGRMREGIEGPPERARVETRGERRGGESSIGSELGGGTTITLTLPTAGDVRA